jgi:N-acetylglucosaminyldiphosphoundecaprenol N-acetyl-beta-D-mannosaminyltransferase
LRIVQVIGVATNAQQFSEAVGTLLNWSKSKDQRFYVSTATAYTLVMANKEPSVQAALNEASMVTADGMPIVWLQRLSGLRDAERVYGPDLMLALCDASQSLGIRHYFYGGLPGIPEKLSQALQARFPGLSVVGVHSPEGDVLSNVPQTSTTELLNNACADVIWVGLGSPKQDLWMSAYRQYLNAPLIIGVGAAFDFLSGTKSQAPGWMQRSGLEWFFRLTREPHRLWKRYLVYNLLFLLLLIRSVFSQKT